MDSSIALSEFKAILDRETLAAYNRGKADAKRDMLDMLTSEPPQAGATNLVAPIKSPNDAPVSARKRAPRGIVAALIAKAIKNSHTYGLAPLDMLEYAETDDEKMVKIASIRGELKRRKGQLYRESGGKWFLISNGEKNSEAAGNDLGGQSPEASDLLTHAKDREANSEDT